MGIDDTYWMTRAYQLALHAESLGEVPVGAVLVDQNNQCIGEGFNQVIIMHDPSAHAEVVALRAGAQRLQNYRLIHTTLYVTLEPCAMCASALVHARVSRLVYAAHDVKAGAAGSAFNFMQHPAFNHKIQCDKGILQHECAEVLRNFFRKRREASK
jgi:tRNA(adenine34) deaminase